MALVTNFNSNPYYDDFDEDKKFLRLLFKPGYAVQARELSQIQTMMQNQINRFGNFVFQNGSLVTGGQIVNGDATYLNLVPVYAETTIVANNFIGQTILSSDESKRAKVVKVYEADEGTNDPITLLVQQVYGENFTSGETIKTNESSPYFANIAASGVGTGQVVSVDTGVYYYDGFFVQTDSQTVAVNKYSNVGSNVRVGYEVTESIVQASGDTTLLDPAQDASNYQAPGADRFKIDLILSTRALDSEDDERFIQIQEIKDSYVTENFNQTQLNVLGDILAQRTFDESGNYTVNPFSVSLETNLANSAQTDVIISPGKAYVYGYEFKKSSPTTITIDKPRESINVQNKRVNVDYGYFLYTKDHLGNFPVNSLGSIDIHCVANSDIDTTSAATIANTKIGTARIKTVNYETSTDLSNSATYVYKTYLFDLQVNDSVVGNVNTALNGAGLVSSNIELANSLISTSYSSVDNAYQGAYLRITTGLGSSEDPKLITAYNGTTKTATLDSGFLTLPNTDSKFSIDFELGSAESFVNFSGTTRVCAANIDTRSKDSASEYNYAFITDSSYEPLLLRLGQDFIRQNTISDMSYSYQKLYTGVTFSSGISPALPVDTGEAITDPGSSSSLIADGFQVICTSAGTSSYVAGEIIPASAISVNAATRQVTVSGGGTMTANVVATIDVTTPTYKSKVYYPANTTIQTSGGIDVFGNGAVTLYATEGQVHIAEAFVNKNPNGINSLYASELLDITSILDFRGAAVSEANKSSADEVITKYLFDNGQRNSVYDHASIRLRAKFTPAQGPLVVFFNRFKSSGPGFFTVDSYTANNVTNYDYGLVPIYNSPTITGRNSVYQLRDVLDFRPVRSDATAGSGSSVTFDIDASTTGPKIPKVGEDIILDYSYYLPRVDKVILDKSQSFQVVTGVSQLNPPTPKDTSTGMSLYVLRNPPYVANTSDVNIEYINNRRYTMSDIGTLDRRITNLEYYTSLSLLEQDSFNKQDLSLRDTENLSRFKNGILVDSFTGTGIVDVLHPDYRTRPLYSIDSSANELRPSFNVDAYNLEFDSANSSGFDKYGPIVSTSGNDLIMIDQPKASRFININPFNIVNFLGKVQLDPSTDFWVDTTTKPEVNVNIGGDLDAWELLAEGAALTEWNSWERVSGKEIFSGVTETSSELVGFRGFGTRYQAQQVTTETTTTLEEVTEQRTGVKSTVQVQQITKSLGDRVVDISVIQYMRGINILFTGEDFRPSTTLYSFFDGKPVDGYVNFLNKFSTVENNLELKTTTADQEAVQIKDSGGTVRATGVAVATSNNIVYIGNMNPSATMDFISSGATITGVTTGKVYNVTGYEHHTGFVQSSSSTTIVLRLDATGSTNYSDYNGASVFITSGPGAGQERTVSSYNPGTRTVTVSTAWTTTPTSSSTYSIGRLRTDVSGTVAGVYSLPNGQFRIGEKQFRLIDNAPGDIPTSRTNGDATFHSQGLMQTKQDVKIQTIVPSGIQRQSVSEDRTFLQASQSVRQSSVSVWIDPLAETFLVSPQQFPQGVFISKMRLCFKSKDQTVPVTLQMRPVVNGYPSSSDIYPYGTVTLTPDKVKTTDIPDFEDASKYTDFTFATPLFLQPGEHSFVLIANSNEYETFAAEIGKKDLATGRQISEQPYGGSLFASQNGSTWTADQNSDITFRMYRKRFNSEPAQVAFKLKESVAEQKEYDVVQMRTSEVVTQNTVLSYQFNSQTLTADYAGYKYIIPAKNYSVNDGSGTRALFPATQNVSFQVAGLMSTLNPDITPFVDTSTIGFVGIKNLINNLELSNSDITLISGGSGYTDEANTTVTVTGGGGSGALLRANVTGAGVVDYLWVEDPGSGYTGTPTVTITDDLASGTGASAVITGETSKTGGPATAKYITRKVSLAEGFDSGDLRVYLTAYKPTGSGIYVYAKYLSSSDPELFEDKQWQLLTQLGDANFVSENEFDFRELTFAPGTDEIAANKITYTNDAGSSFDSFKTFAIKIVMTGEQTYDVVRIRDFRAIALPAKRLT